MSLLNRLKKPDGSSPSPTLDPSKSKMSKKPSLKSDESDDDDADTPTSSISKMAMPKILIRGVGPNSTKTPVIKTKLSTSKPNSGQKKGKSKLILIMIINFLLLYSHKSSHLIPSDNFFIGNDISAEHLHCSCLDS